ncbi:MAG TPA: family 16 glycoside hydrolase, partial [Lacunisphaera sp.]|nr:family 16 glycoside hydrolase [Lacunisphaera sp.]
PCRSGEHQRADPHRADHPPQSRNIPKSFLRLPRLLCLLWLAPLLPAATYNVRDFGATGDGVTKDTRAFQQALDTCAVNGGGEVSVPAGRYLIGSVQQGNRTIIRLAADSVIVGSPDAADYPMIDIRWEGRMQPGRRALIHAANVEHIGIIGPGRIEGDPGMAAPQNPRGSVVLEPMNCVGVHWEGFTVIQGGNWATHPTFCTDVTIKNLVIRGRRDGIDVDSCRNVRIEGCDIETGDDAISLKSGRGMDGARLGRPTENVLIADCNLRCTRFAAIGIGSETSAGVRDVRIERCKFTAHTHAIYIKTRTGRAGVTENISGEDLEVLGGGFLRINLTVGGNTNTADDPVPGIVGYPEARNLSFKNVRLANASVIVEGAQVSAEKPVDGLTLTNITGTAAKGITLVHARRVALSGINVTGLTGPLLATENVTGTGLEGAVPYVAPKPAPPRTTLWNGRDLTGWKLFLQDAATDPASVWKATNGILRFDTKASGYIRTERSFSNYRLHVEWRWAQDAPANANSGVMLHVHGPDVLWPLCFEAQLKNGNAGQFVGMGLDIPDAPVQNNRKRAPRLADPSEKPLGEWNSYDITARNDTVEVLVNGVRQNHATKLPVTAGAIALQMEGFPIEFRNVWLEPL